MELVIFLCIASFVLGGVLGLMLGWYEGREDLREELPDMSPTAEPLVYCGCFPPCRNCPNVDQLSGRPLA